MTRILDTLPTFEAFASEVELESPLVREWRWQDRYEDAHPDVFAAYYAAHHGSRDRPAAMLQGLARVRERVREGAPLVREIIDEVDPAVRRILDAPEAPDPVHVLLVGSAGANAAVGRLGDDVAVFHCLEWFEGPEAARVLVAHEGTHAWHEILLGQALPDGDPAWVAFSEGLATRVSRVAVPGHPEPDYFWYGHFGFDTWLAWCREHRDELRARFREGLDDPGTLEAFFGAKAVDGRHRTGYFLADDLVGALDRPLPELARLGVDEARAAVRSALGAS